MTGPERYAPTSVDQASDWIQNRIHHRAPFQIRGACARSQAAPDLDTLTTTGLDALNFFHPDDMVIGVSAGMRFTTLRQLLAEKGMTLPVNPWRQGATIGGMAAGNEFGPDRLYGGGIRDDIIGIEYINGKGTPVRAGGKVVKNVSGYDLGRMMIGSLGGLGLITSLNFKVRPQPTRPHTLFLKSSDASWLDGVHQIHGTMIPIDWLQCVYREGCWVLGIGVSGNQARRQRLSESLQKIFKGRLEIAPAGEEPAYCDFFRPDHRFGGFLTPHLDDGLALHLHAIYPIRTLFARFDARAWSEGPVKLVFHPLGGDIHFLFQESPDPHAILARVRSFFPDRGGCITVEKLPKNLNLQPSDHPNPLEFQLMQRLKQRLDPHGIFFAPFYA